MTFSFSKANYLPPPYKAKTKAPGQHKAPELARKAAKLILKKCRPKRPVFLEEVKDLTPDCTDQLAKRVIGGGYPGEKVKNPGGLGLDSITEDVRQPDIDGGGTRKVTRVEFSKDNIARCYQYLEEFYSDDFADMVDEYGEELEELLADTDE